MARSNVNFSLAFDNPILEGSTLAGVIVATLDVETWSPIGTSGSVVDEFTGARLGTYEIVLSVPIPAALPLFATALAGVGFFGWRRKRMTETG